jgi:hypothetical protein
MQWRRWNNVIHRDLGYLCVGLTLVYVVSGIAVNHISDWNPNYRIERRTAKIGPIDATDLESPGAVRGILARLGLAPAYRTTFRPDTATLRIFLEDGTADVDLATGRATVEMVRERSLIRAANVLHLNVPKRLWTWIADLYAVSLGLLAVTGLFVLKGKKGVTGRGAWLTAVGVAVPLLFLWIYR